MRSNEKRNKIQMSTRRILFAIFSKDKGALDHNAKPLMFKASRFLGFLGFKVYSFFWSYTYSYSSKSFRVWMILGFRLLSIESTQRFGKGIIHKSLVWNYHEWFGLCIWYFKMVDVCSIYFANLACCSTLQVKIVGQNLKTKMLKESKPRQNDEIK